MQLYMKDTYDTPQKLKRLEASMDHYFNQLQAPLTAKDLDLVATVVPAGLTANLYLPISRLSFADDASIKGAPTK